MENQQHDINPYQPPKSRIGDKEAGVTTYANKRPVLVWIIFIWSILAIFGVILSYALIYVFKIPLSEAQITSMKNVSSIEHVLTFVGITLFFAAALMLFIRKRIAITLFGIRLAMITGASIYFSFFRATAEAASLTGMSLVKPAVTILLAALFLYYVIYLKKKFYYK